MAEAGRPPIPWRQIVRDQLEQIASAEEQLDYQRRVPNIDVGREVVALWFSNSYFPNDVEFRKQFSDEELNQLAFFNGEFERRIAGLPKWKPIEAWLLNESWLEVMRCARSTLEVLRG
jgi:hypothetical protein